jgi:hypothetical protein
MLAVDWHCHQLSGSIRVTIELVGLSIAIVCRGGVFNSGFVIAIVWLGVQSSHCHCYRLPGSNQVVLRVLETFMWAPNGGKYYYQEQA